MYSNRGTCSNQVTREKISELVIVMQKQTYLEKQIQIESLEREREAALRLLSEAQAIHDRIPQASADQSVLLEEARRRAKERAFLTDMDQKSVKRYQDGTEERETAFNYCRYEQSSKSRTEGKTGTKPNIINNDKDAVEFKDLIDEEYLQLKQELEGLKRGSKVVQREVKNPEKSATPSIMHSWDTNIGIKCKERPTRDVETKLFTLKAHQTLNEAPIDSMSTKRSPSTRLFTTESSRVAIVPDTSRKSLILSERYENECKSQRKSARKLDTSTEIVTPKFSPSPRKPQRKKIAHSNDPPHYQEPPQRHGWTVDYPPQQPVWNQGYNQYLPYPYPTYQYPMYPYNFPYYYQEPIYSYPPPSTSFEPPSYKNSHHDPRKNNSNESRNKNTGGRDRHKDEWDQIKEQTFGKSDDDKRKMLAGEVYGVWKENGVRDDMDKYRKFDGSEFVREWGNVGESKHSKRSSETFSGKEEMFMFKSSSSVSNGSGEMDERHEIEYKDRKTRENERRERRERRESEKTNFDIGYSRNTDKEKLRVGESDRADIDILNLIDEKSNTHTEGQFIETKKKSILIEIGTKQKKSLAEMFREKNNKVAESIHNREDHMVKQDHKFKTKQELIEIRKNFVKASPKSYQKRADLIEVQIEERKSGKEPSSELMERLATGQRVKITKEEMIKLNKKNYKMLPEVKKRQEDEKKKLEKQQRIEKAKEYERVRYIQNRQDKQRSKYLPDNY